MFVIINIINLVKWEFDNLVQTTVLFHEEVATRTGWPLLPDVVAPVPGRKITVIVQQIFFLPKQLTAFRNTAKNALTCCFFPINKTFCFKHIICELNLIRISAEHLKRSLCSTDNVHCACWPLDLFQTCSVYHCCTGCPIWLIPAKKFQKDFDFDRAEGATDRFRFQHF